MSSDKSIFNSNPDLTTELWNQLLNIQVEAFAERDIKTLKNCGFFSDEINMIDAGCGNGTFARYLASKYEINLYIGVDGNKELLEIFKERPIPMERFQLINWDFERNDNISKDFTKVNKVLLKLVLQHHNNPVKFLSRIKESVPKNSLLYIIEEDDNLQSSYPYCAPYNKFLETLASCNKLFNSTRTIGKKMPLMAKEAGLDVVDFDIYAYSSFIIGNNFFELLKCATRLIEEMSPEHLSREEAKELKDGFDSYQNENNGNHNIIFPGTITVLRT